MVSRMCEEFGCLPSALEGEDVATLLIIMDYRSYARAKQMLDDSTDPTNAPRTPAVNDVWATEHELLKRRNRAREVDE